MNSFWFCKVVRKSRPKKTRTLEESLVIAQRLANEFNQKVQVFECIAEFSPEEPKKTNRRPLEKSTTVIVKKRRVAILP